MFAVIKTGGKQYLVEPGEKLDIEKLPNKDGSEVTFKEVMLVEKNKKMDIGEPLVAGATVTGKVIKTDKQKKVIIFKFKAKKRQSTKTGHRQPYTRVEITNIETGK